MFRPPRADHFVKLSSLLLMAAAAGALLFTAFPPLDFGPVGWVALVPLFFAISQTRSVMQGAACGLVFGIVFFGAYLHYFFTLWGWLPWMAATIYQSLYPAVFGLLAALAMRQTLPEWRVLGGASAWALTAYLRANAGTVAFSGGDLAYSQYDQLPLLQMVSVVGQMGLTFAMAMVNAALSQALLGILPFPLWRPATDLKKWSKRSARVAVICYGILIAAYVWGALVLKTASPETGKRLQVAVVQGSVHMGMSVTDEDVQNAKETYLKLVGEVPQGTDLTILPESAFPSYMPTHPGSEEWARQVAKAARGSHVILGTLERYGKYDYNAARLYDPHGNMVARYRKIDLVIYGEYVPLRERLKFLERYPIRQRDLTRGTRREVFRIGEVAVSPLICFEALFSRPTREVCRLGAEVLAVLTSDAWAEGTVEVEQHSRTAPLRAVEARRYLCRAATMGQSAIYTPYGELITSIPVNGKGVATETVTARQGLSPYHRLGDNPFLAAWLALLVVAIWKQHWGR